nr:hypothetical protein [Methylobacterium sp. L1A1]
MTAEITGKEVARWNVLLEEPEPREGRQDRTSGGQDGREARRGSDGRSDQRRGRPGARQGRSGVMLEHERRERSAAERRASQSLRDRGIDPEAPMSSDPLPF